MFSITEAFHNAHDYQTVLLDTLNMHSFCQIDPNKAENHKDFYRKVLHSQFIEKQAQGRCSPCVFMCACACVCGAQLEPESFRQSNFAF